MRLVQMFDQVECALAQCLTDWIEKHKYQIRNVALLTGVSCKKGFILFKKKKSKRTKPQNGLVDIERVLHVTIHQTRRVNQCQQAELLLLACRNFRTHIVQDTIDVIQRLHLGIQMQRCISRKRLAFFTACDQSETLSFDCDTGLLNGLLNIPIDKGAFTFEKKVSILKSSLIKLKSCHHTNQPNGFQSGEH
jgi:hypothetical protein